MNDHLLNRRDPHEDHPGVWECLGCGRDVCPVCESSPAEEVLCAECDWAEDPGPGAA